MRGARALLVRHLLRFRENLAETGIDYALASFLNACNPWRLVFENAAREVGVRPWTRREPSAGNSMIIGSILPGVFFRFATEPNNIAVVSATPYRVGGVELLEQIGLGHARTLT